MRSRARRLLSSLPLAACLFFAVERSAAARPLYKLTWDELYLVEGSAMFQALHGKGTCSICHRGGGKSVRSEYGRAFGDCLGHKDEKDRAVVAEALRKAEQVKSSDGRTFGELIEAGKLLEAP